MCQEPVDRGEEQVPLGIRVGGLRWGQIRYPAGKGRQQPSQFGAVRGDVRQELLLGGVRDEVPKRLDKELIWGRQVLLTMSEQHAGSAVEGGTGCLGHQGGLALAGFA